MVREALAELVRGVWPAMGAAVTASHPMVEANLLAGPDGGHHIALVNYSGQPLAEVELRIRKADAGQPTGAKAQFSAARVTDADGLLIVTLPIDRFDFISLQR